MWGLADWCGTLFRPRSKPAEFLEQYASVFNCVEGNTTFYGTPAPDTVKRWRDATPETFRFCFKFPKIVTHNIKLREHARVHVEEFFEAMSPLGPRLGPFFIQLSQYFPGEDVDILEQFVRWLPLDFDYALEVRHPDFFPGGKCDSQLSTLLAELEIDRVIFDTRGLREADSQDPVVRQTQRKKPNTQWRAEATGAQPFIRYCAGARVGGCDHLLAGWADQVVAWMQEGKRPLFFVHSPGDLTVPELARRFHEMVSERASVGELPPYPATGGQLSLF
jgi:uncharacterized protein YecE (DUF72 family)